MKINSINNTTFRAAPTKKGLEEMDKLCREGEKILHPEGTFTMFDCYNYSLPENPKQDTGIGKFTSQCAVDFAKTMKPYVGMDAEKIYPIGRFVNRRAAGRGFFCPYERGSLTIGDDNIDFFQLTTPKWEKILDVNNFVYTVRENSVRRKSPNTINYENEIDASSGSRTKRLMSISLKNFNKLPETHKLRQEYEEYKKKPLVKDVYEKLALWPEFGLRDPNLFVDFDKSPEKQQRYAGYLNEFQRDVELFKFTQFVAYKQVQDAIEQYKKAGIELVADVPIGFSAEEYWVFKDAFHKDKSIGYEFPLMKYEEMGDKDSLAYKLFRQKMEFVAGLFDKVRLDVGTSYIERDYAVKKDGKWDWSEKLHYDYGEQITDIIEDVFKQVKGDNYDPNNIMYEAEGEAGKFIDWNAPKPVPKGLIPKKNLILTTQYERDPNPETGDWGYGRVDFYTDVAGMDKKKLVIGATNHDGMPTRRMAEDSEVRYEKTRKDSRRVFERVFGRSKAYLRRPENFFRTKMAEVQLAPNRFYYYVDVFGMNDAINEYGAVMPDKERFRLRLPYKYEEAYHKELQKDRAFNRPEALSLALRSTGLSKKHPLLTKKLDYLGYYLRKRGPLTTQDAEKIANKTGKDELMEQLREFDRMA